RPGTKKARNPAVSASLKASATRSCPTRRAESSARPGRCATLPKRGRPSASSLVGCTPQAGIPDRTISSTIRPCRGEAPTTATERGNRRGRTRVLSAIARSYHPLHSGGNVHEKQIEIRWRDQDAYGHVNNAVYLTYLEEVRDGELPSAPARSGGR